MGLITEKFWPKLKVDIVQTMWAWAKISWRTPFIPVDGVEGAASGIHTAGTDGKSIWFNEPFMEKHDYSEQGGIAYHEVGHIAMLHPWRRGSRDAEVWNYAADYEMNIFLEEYFIHSGRRWAGKPQWRLPESALLDRQYSGMSAETIYKLLIANAKARLPDDASMEEVKEEVRKQILESQPGAGEQPGEESGEANGGEGQPGKGDGNVAVGTSEGLPTDEPGWSNQATDQPLPQAADLMPPKNEDGSEMNPQQMEEHVQEQMKQIEDRLEKVAKQPTKPGEGNEKLGQVRNWQNSINIWKDDQQCTRPAMDVTERVAAWVDASIVTNYSYRKYNRRMGHVSEIMHPGKINDSLRFGVICIDTSSSIDKAELDVSMKIASNILNRVHMPVKFVSVDSKVYHLHVSELEVGDPVTLKNVGVMGGGGTKFEEIFKFYNPAIHTRDYTVRGNGSEYGSDVLNHEFKGKYHKLSMDDPSVMIFITGDGETSLSFKEFAEKHAPPPWPMLWVVGKRDSPVKSVNGALVKAVPGSCYESKYRKQFTDMCIAKGYGEIIEFTYVLDHTGNVTGVR